MVLIMAIHLHIVSNIIEPGNYSFSILSHFETQLL